MSSASHSITPTHKLALDTGIRLALLLFALVFIILSVSLDSDFHNAAADENGVETTRTITWALKLDGESPTNSCDSIDAFISGTQREESTGTCDTHWKDLCHAVRWTLGLGFSLLVVAFCLNFTQWLIFLYYLSEERESHKKEGKDKPHLGWPCRIFVENSWCGKIAGVKGQGILGLAAWAMFVSHGVTVHVLLVECTDMPYPITLYVLSSIGNLLLLYYGVASIADRMCCFSCRGWCGESSKTSDNIEMAAGFY